jgi:hypothetical protein
VRACAVASTSVIADFEDDKKAGVAANGFPGIWSANAGATTAQTATSVLGASTDTLTPPTCNKWALHATASGITYTDPTGSEYAQEFAPLASKSATAFPTTDLSAYDGISFDIKLGSGTTGTGSPLAFELLTAVSQPPGAPPTGDFGTATTAGVDQYNNRSWMLWNNTTPLSTTWQRIYVPFHVMVPHWLPSGCKGSPCGAPALSAKAAMAVQWAVNPSQGPSASFLRCLDRQRHGVHRIGRPLATGGLFRAHVVEQRLDEVELLAADVRRRREGRRQVPSLGLQQLEDALRHSPDREPATCAAT